MKSRARPNEPICGELDISDLGDEVVLMGWVHKRRDHGG